jgi:hypothetical protein
MPNRNLSNDGLTVPAVRDGDSGIAMSAPGPGWQRDPGVVAISSAPNTAASIFVGGAASAICDIAGTFSSGTWALEGSIDGGSTWATIHTFMAFDLLNSRHEVSQAGVSTARRYLIDTATFTHLRLNVSALTSGTMNVRWLASLTPRTMFPANQMYSGLSSTSRTSTTSSADQSNYWNRGAYFVLDVTNVPGSAPSLTLSVEGKDGTTGKYFTIFAATTPITATGTTAYPVMPGAPETAGLSTGKPLPRTYRVTVTHGNANSVTYAVGINAVV